MSVSIIIPTFNAASRIHHCLDALLPQAAASDGEIIVVDDGSSDGTGDIVRRYQSVRLITQVNSGPASARNRGAAEAKGDIILFTDDDCVPTNGWLQAMTEAFQDPDVVAVKGAYRTLQKAWIARFVQLDYEDRYRLMATLRGIDFVDTYSAEFRRDRFLELNGYDTSFPVACAEDAELSYRMSERGWKMIFVPTAIVYHVILLRSERFCERNTSLHSGECCPCSRIPKNLEDSHTSQIMNLQLLFGRALLIAGCCGCS